MMKKIKLRNFEIEGIVKSLSNPNSLLYTDDPTKKLPVSVLWVMDENMDKLRSISTRIQKKRDEIERGYADDDHSFTIDSEDGPVRRVKDEYLKEFSSQINELMNIENEIEISAIDVNKLSDFSLIPSDYRSIRFMLENPMEVEVVDENETDEKDEAEKQ